MKAICMKSKNLAGYLHWLFLVFERDLSYPVLSYTSLSYPVLSYANLT
jgi:hypothetical protein